MANEAERVVVELLAKVDGFDGKVKQSASSFGNSMNKVEDSAERAEKQVKKSAGEKARAEATAAEAAKQAADKTAKAADTSAKASERAAKAATDKANTVRRAAQVEGAAVQSTGTALVRQAETTERASRGINSSFRSTTNSARNLGFQISDIGTQLAAGTSPFIVLAQQGPQVANALEGAKGKVGQFAAFLSGPWGAALLAATTILGVFIGKMLEGGESVDDMVKKLKEQEKRVKDTAEAEEKFGKSVEGVTKALRENKEALDKLKGAQDTAAEAGLKNAAAQLKEQLRIREKTVALLEQAKLQQEIATGTFGAGGNLEAGGIIQANRQVAELEKLLQQARKNVIEARRQVDEAGSLITVERALASEEDKITRRYDIQIESARKAAVASGKVQKELEKEVERIKAARDAEIKRLRDTERERRKTSQGLPPVTGQEVARALGTSITSGTRTPAQNRAAKGAANSYHLSGQAIDIPLKVNGKPLTKAGIRAALEPLGIVIKELLGPGDKGHSDHFHIAFDKKRRGPDDVAEAQERAAEEEIRRRQSFENELASLLSDEIDARQSLVTSAEEIAKLELEAIEISRKKYDDNLNALVEQGKLHDEEAKELRRINEERARLRAELVKRREDERKFRLAEAENQREAEFYGALRDTQADVIQGQLRLAETQKERRRLENALLELQYQEERARNEYIIAYAERLKTQKGIKESELREAEAAAEIAELRLQTLDQRRGQDQARSDRQTAGPLENFFQSIPDTADEINEALEAVAAGGLATFTDALTDAIVNFRSLGDVGRAVLQSITAALVKMAIQQVLLRTIGQTAGAAALAATGAQATAAAVMWAPAAALASLATLGTNAGPAAAALAATTALSKGLALTSVAGFAEGGQITGPGGPRGDRIPIMASDGEFMIRAASARKIGVDRLDFINRTGMLPAFADGGVVRSIRPSNASAATTGGFGGGLDESALRRIESAVERGAAAQAPVNLYPTLEPARALEAMLASPGGQRAFFNFVSNNSARFKSQLNS